MADIVERWMWRAPGEIIERLVARSGRCEQRGEAVSTRAPSHTTRDRYYTQARRLHVKQLMRGKA
jgi:hypothetical protein